MTSSGSRLIRPNSETSWMCFFPIVTLRIVFVDYDIIRFETDQTNFGNFASESI